VDAALQAACKKDLRLVLVWPGQADSIALIHALATLERTAIGDKRGLRALAYPTTRLTFSTLSQTAVDRERLLEWARHYLTVSTGIEPPIAGRDDQNKDMMLMALQSARNVAPQGDLPMLAEVLPHFEWDRESKSWGHYGDRYLRRSKRALERSHKRALFKKEEDGRIAQLGNPPTAPDALFGITHLASAEERRAALKSKALNGEDLQPEVVLLDATREMRLRTDKYLIRVIPEFIEDVIANWAKPCGFLVVTDDPKSYFAIRKSLAERISGRRLNLIAETLITDPSDRGLSETPLPVNWIPSVVSLRHFPVGVLDQEASEAALRFWNLSEKFAQGSEAFNACREAAAYMLRLANLPGGYRDYTSWMSSQGVVDSVRRDMSWTGHEYRLQGLLDRGEFAARAEDVRRAMKRAAGLIDAYGDSTPLAARIAKEVGLCATKTKLNVAVMFRFNTDIPVAQLYLQRYGHYPNKRLFSEFEQRVALMNHRELPKLLADGDIPDRFIFVGLPDETVKLLVSSERVPADSVILVDFRRANDVLIGLRALQTIETYKPYRGRIAGLANEIGRRIGELPRAVDLEKLERMRVPRLSLSAAASDASRRSEVPGAWRVELEGGRRTYVGQKVYIYDPDEARPFHQEDIENVKPGDHIFVMSDELKDRFESCLIEAGHPVMRGASLGEMVRSYHRHILQSARRLFGDLKGLALARQIQQRMTEIAPQAKVCSLNRIRYWMDVEDSAETAIEDLRPHSTWSATDFATFARALDVPENLIGQYWMMVTGQRRALQEAGRELADRYARVLFSEETAETLYRLRRETILMLQREAVQSAYRVVRTFPPLQSKEGAHE